MLATGACQAGPAADDRLVTADGGGPSTDDQGPTTGGGGPTTDGGLPTGGGLPTTEGGLPTTDGGESTADGAASTESGGEPLGCDAAGETPLPDTGQLYFVAASGGSDSNAGDEAAPLATIQEGIDRAVAGDTIVLRGGTYTQNVRFRDSGEEGQPITLRNYPGETPVIDNEHDGNAIVIQATNYQGGAIGWITLDGLEVKNGHGKNIEITNGHDIVVTRCHLHSSNGQGIGGNGTRVLIDGNVIADNGDFVGNQEHGIYTSGKSWTISNNLIYGNAFWGIQVAGYEDISYAPGPEYTGASDWFIVNNTFAFAHNRSGIVLYAGAENDVIQNNIFFNNRTDEGSGDSGVSFYNSGGGHQLINNLHFGPGPFVSIHPAGMYYSETGTIDGEDPLFVDADSLDFHLQADSPAKNQGAATDAPATDHEGRSRPQGAGPDVGAFEACE